MENKIARFMRNTGAIRFFLPLGIILVVLGAFMVKTTPDQYAETLGRVTGVEQYREDDKDVCDIEFEYAVEGKKYTGVFYGLEDIMEAGDEVTVYYDPDEPGNISNSKHTGVIGIAMIAVGALAAVFGTLSSLKKIKKSRELDARAEAEGYPEEARPVPKDMLTEYYVMFDGNSLKPGYIVEDDHRNVVYEAPMTKNSLVSKRIFAFSDLRRGITTEHEVGHTMTTSYSNEFFSENSWFSFDGKNIWDVLHDCGIRISTDIHSQFPKAIYTVSLNGRFFATIETSGRAVHEEDAAEQKLNVPFGKYYYRCWTIEDDMDLLFLTVFALSESEQAVVE